MRFVKDICEMVSKIGSERRLKQIYTVVHRLYLHDVAENGGEVHRKTEEERLRENIDGMLDKLNADELKGVDIFYSHSTARRKLHER